ncbi:MAG: hypothetical protein QMD99_07190, partial [Rhizobiaceae bacterium]|nr:hypothetical protein [Rhizobiaceae bacterium]
MVTGGITAAGADRTMGGETAACETGDASAVKTVCGDIATGGVTARVLAGVAGATVAVRDAGTIRRAGVAGAGVAGVMGGAAECAELGTVSAADMVGPGTGADTRAGGTAPSVREVPAGTS